MELYEGLLTRRSIRKYEDKDISDDTIQELLKAAMRAPSAVNSQPWSFIIVKNRETLQNIAQKHKNAHMAAGAPLAIVVCGDNTIERYKDYWIQDCAAATQNILLAAHAKGLGAVWTGVHPREERVSDIRQTFEIPDNYTPFSIIIIGYPAETKEHPDRYDSSRIHHEKW